MLVPSFAQVHSGLRQEDRTDSHIPCVSGVKMALPLTSEVPRILGTVFPWAGNDTLSDLFTS